MFQSPCGERPRYRASRCWLTSCMPSKWRRLVPKGACSTTDRASPGEWSAARSGVRCGCRLTAIEFHPSLISTSPIDKGEKLNRLQVQIAAVGIALVSLVAVVVRKGNPKHITTWDDLVKPGVQVITPNPFTSGGARWNVMAAYGAELKEGKTPAQAQQYLSTLFHHVPVQDDKASAAMTTFTGGKGDVLLAYEQDALLAQESGADI